MPETNTSQEGALENPAMEGSQQMFTQDQVNSIVGNTRKEERAKYADFEKYKEGYKKLQELEESQKTELERAVSRAEAAENELAEIKRIQQVSQWKSEVAKETGVPVDIINGSTKEEMEECATKLQEYIPKTEERDVPYVASDGFAPLTSDGKATRDQFAAALDDLL